MKHDLARVIDPSALEAAAGARARLRVEVAAAWLLEGAELEVVAPARLACARCDGGGCDGCGRSGAVRAPDDASARAVRVHVPAGDGRAVALRLVQPFGDGGLVDQLLLELTPGDADDGRVRRVERPAPAPAPTAPALGPGAFFAIALVVIVLLAAALGGGR